ncbi:hypothetical protein UA08_04671 [Talaromyces atroroseus]|uniref:Uncharacterized protein n=1 Tax=Talaromyces atroroseus TaxID=1441469 RepID=A0A225AHA0_TALAT|nr:hypothetical protein UA08_04671 [Talaromyces atroroseus]OKL60120.1 hypothetical protein UA08_04671 [Talaromyces atroroseus]
MILARDSPYGTLRPSFITLGTTKGTREPISTQDAGPSRRNESGVTFFYMKSSRYATSSGTAKKGDDPIDWLRHLEMGNAKSNPVNPVHPRSSRPHLAGWNCRKLHCRSNISEPYGDSVASTRWLRLRISVQAMEMDEDDGKATKEAD